MSKIIDANKVQLKLLEESKNIRHFDKDRKKSQIFADGIDFAWVMLDNAPTVDAIPIEWILNKYRGKWEKAEMGRRDFQFIEVIDELLADWKKENQSLE